MFNVYHMLNLLSCVRLSVLGSIAICLFVHFIKRTVISLLTPSVGIQEDWPSTFKSTSIFRFPNPESYSSLHSCLPCYCIVDRYGNLTFQGHTWNAKFTMLSLLLSMEHFSLQVYIFFIYAFPWQLIFIKMTSASL